MGDLAGKHCAPCEGGVPPLPAERARSLLGELSGEWRIVDGHHREKTFRFGDFRSALSFASRLGEVAETKGHHPDILVSWDSARVTVRTHKVDGLTESDFILAAKADRAEAV